MLRHGKMILDPQMMGYSKAEELAAFHFMTGKFCTPPTSVTQVGLHEEFNQLLPLFVDSYMKKWKELAGEQAVRPTG